MPQVQVCWPGGARGQCWRHDKPCVLVGQERLGCLVDYTFCMGAMHKLTITVIMASLFHSTKFLVGNLYTSDVKRLFYLQAQIRIITLTHRESIMLSPGWRLGVFCKAEARWNIRLVQFWPECFDVYELIVCKFC